MKSPLRYQISEFDTGAVSLLNSLSYLFEREEMPAELVRAITIFSLDSYDMKGKVDFASSRNVVYSVSRWIAEFAKQKNIPLKCSYLKGDAVDIFAIVNCLKQGGCVNLRTYYNDGASHYVTLTAIDNEYIYMFDPYFQPMYQQQGIKNIQVIDDNPFGFNRRVKLDYFLSEKKFDLTLGLVYAREALLLFRDDSIMERELG